MSDEMKGENKKHTFVLDYFLVLYFSLTHFCMGYFSQTQISEKNELILWQKHKFLEEKGFY